MKVFISYAREDLQFVRILEKYFARYEVTLWIDVNNITTNKGWDDQVKDGMDASDTMLLVLSPAAVASENVANEWHYFVEKKKDIIPLIIADCDVPFRISRRQRVDFRGEFKSAFIELVRLMKITEEIDYNITDIILPPQNYRQTKPVSTAGEELPLPRTAPLRRSPAAVAPEIAVRLLPVIWGEHYHWFNGMRGSGVAGELLINSREIALIPRADPMILIPLANLVDVKELKGVDNPVKITYVGLGGGLASQIVMSAPPERRKEINEEIASSLKYLKTR